MAIPVADLSINPVATLGPPSIPSMNGKATSGDLLNPTAVPDHRFKLARVGLVAPYSAKASQFSLLNALSPTSH